MSTLEIDQTIKELETNGYAVINKYLSNTVELINFKHKFYELVCIKAKQWIRRRRDSRDYKQKG